jgi:phage/plasmid-associated DNA primase
VTTAAPEPTPPQKHLTPGQINLDLLPVDFPLTPLRGKKAYLPGWTSDPKTVAEIRKELDEGRATGVGLLCGQWSNELALIMVDVDGEEAIPAIEALGGGPIGSIFPPTLTISSGKPGRFRMVFRVPSSKVQQLPDKATLKVDKAPWEILWRSRQGALMGAHPDTDGYRTTAQGGFEWCKNLPEMPDWLYEQIFKAYPSSRYRKRNAATPGIFVAQSINLNYEEDSEFQKESILEEAREYLVTLNPERADDYEEWVAVGMALHQIDDLLLNDWVEWSAQSSHFEDGCCEEKWGSFERLPGGHSPEGARGLKTLRAKAKEDGYVNLGGFEVPNLEVIQKRVAADMAEMGIEMPFGPQNLFGNRRLGEKFGYGEDDDDDDDEGGGDGSCFMGRKKGSRNPPSSEIANFIMPMFMKLGWRYDAKFDVFMQYDKHRGVWNKQDHSKDFKQQVQFQLENLNLPNGYSTNLIADVTSLMEGHIAHYDWCNDPTRLAFQNGVLELDTDEFVEHSPDNYITWGLDFKYDPTADPGPITEWLFRTQYGDEARVQVLRAWLRSCLVGKGNEIQRFLEVIGPGGRGKSTFANLCCALVGCGNFASTTLNQLEQSRFELSSIKGKRLTLINDSERYGGSAQTFKALTGGDSLRYEEKLKSIGEPFVYTGMVMVAANEPIQTTDNTSGLSRRRLTIEFNRSLYNKSSEAKDMIKIDKGHISGLWKDYLPGLVNWVLAMSEQDMRRYLLDTQELVPSLRKVRNNILLNSNNLIEWLQSECVYDEKHVSAVGKKIPAPREQNGGPTERYCNSSSHLYPSYCSFAEDTGSKAVGQKRFINLLMDCCRNQLGMDTVSTFSKYGRPFFKGIAIRGSDQKFKSYPTVLAEGKEEE